MKRVPKLIGRQKKVPFPYVSPLGKRGKTKNPLR